MPHRRSRRRSRPIGLVAGATALATLAAACSVATPRNGWTTAGADGAAQPAAAASAPDADRPVAAPAGTSGSSSADSSTSRTNPGTASSAGAEPEPAGQSAAPDAADGRQAPEPTTGGDDASADAGGGSSDAAGNGDGGETSRGSGGSGAVGVTGDTIALSFVAGFSGQYGASVQAVYNGFQTWVDDINSRGGIHGREVRIKQVDHKGTADGGVAACKEVLNNGTFTALIGQGVEANTTATNCLDEAEFVNLYYASADAFSKDWTHSYSFLASYDDQGASVASFVDNQLGEGDKKLGVIYVNQLIYDYQHRAYLNAVEERGMDVVGVEAVEPNQASFTSELLRLQQQGAENIAMFVTVEAIGILRDARALNYDPTFTGASYVFDFITAGARNTADGVTGLRWSATIDSPAYDEFKRKAEETGNEGTLDGEAFLYYGYGLVLEEVLRSAGPQPTKDSLITGIESIRGYDNGIMPPLTWGPGDLEGTPASFPAICCLDNYAWRGLGPPARTF